MDEGLDQALLNGVQGIILVSQQPAGHAKRRLLVSPEKVVRGIPVPTTESFKQLGLVKRLERRLGA